MLKNPKKTQMTIKFSNKTNLFECSQFLNKNTKHYSCSTTNLEGFCQLVRWFNSRLGIKRKMLHSKTFTRFIKYLIERFTSAQNWVPVAHIPSFHYLFPHAPYVRSVSTMKFIANAVIVFNNLFLGNLKTLCVTYILCIQKKDFRCLIFYIFRNEIKRQRNKKFLSFFLQFFLWHSSAVAKLKMIYFFRHSWVLKSWTIMHSIE